ncbi:carbon-nitrogen hydrolase [Colletotrichum navitas]|uniref:Carbon-nitrogen hydrolase n=1 Tax=Colletotrichum navitas TaxID=681940 RepID=A0AAD8Q6L6_9PEZI|nr:carbon-nitrogen hydrolase [Colletotrichum navitas]KAK1596695.1 carbon-nitrogen hydrolase [Colletotrichum navitas]
MPPIRLATASPATGPTTAATLRHIALLASRASAHGADLLLLPEAYLGAGYPRGASFGSKIGSRAPEGRDEYLAYFRAAVDLGDTVGHDGAGAGDRWLRRELPAQNDSASTAPDEEGRKTPERGDGTREELEAVASRTGVFLVVGCIERAGGSLYCSVVYVCPRLGVIGKRRKVMPTATERLIWAQGSPATLRAVSTTIKGVRVNLAAAICWENYMPLLRQALYAQNVNLYLAPTADGRDTWLPLMRTVACEGRCFVVSSNMAVRHPGTPSAPSSSAACVVEDGFEIALPGKPPAKPANGTAAGPPPRSRRRKSVIVEDGNEIVLPGEHEPLPANGYSDVAGSSGGTDDTKTAAAADWVSRGGSCIVGPFGDVLAGPQWEDDEGIIYADVDFDDCVRGRLDIDVGASYSRNDSFNFSVNGLDLDPLPYY